MKRIAPMIIAVLLLIGCDQGISRAEYNRQVAAKEKAQFIAGLLAITSIIALVVGAALGSRAANE